MRNTAEMKHVNYLLDQIKAGNPEADKELEDYTQSIGWREHEKLNRRTIVMAYQAIKKAQPMRMDKDIASDLGISPGTLTHIKQDYGIVTKRVPVS